LSDFGEYEVQFDENCADLEFNLKNYLVKKLQERVKNIEGVISEHHERLVSIQG